MLGAIVFATITAIAYPFYRHKIELFISSFTILFLGYLFIIVLIEDGDSIGSVPFNGFFLLQFVGAATLFTNARLGRDFIPIAYALALSSILGLLLLAYEPDDVYGDSELGYYFINLLLTFGLITLFWLLFRATDGSRRFRIELFALACAGAVLLGAHMRLSYAIEESASDEELRASQKRGYMVVRPNKNNVAQLSRFYSGDALALDEKLRRFHKGGRGVGRVMIVPNVFFFQDGHGQYYENAKHGVFKFADSGSLLVGLADADRQIIQPPIECTLWCSDVGQANNSLP